MVLLLGLLLILSSDLRRSAAFTPQETSTIALQTSIAVRPTTAFVPPSATIPATVAATPLSQQPSAIPDSETPVLPSSPPTLPVPALATPFGRLAFTSNRDGNHEIYLLYLGDGSLQRLTKSADDDWLPVLLPVGDGLLVASLRDRT